MHGLHVFPVTTRSSVTVGQVAVNLGPYDHFDEGQQQVISRIYVKCLTCGGATTARVQVGHQTLQSAVIVCPHCESEMRFSLLLDAPPNVGLRWDENCEEGQEEGVIVNVGAGFAISKDRLHDDLYFPSMEMMPLVEEQLKKMLADHPDDQEGAKWLDQAMVLGGALQITDSWKIVNKAWRLHRTGRTELRDAQIAEFWAHTNNDDQSIEGMLFAFFSSFLSPKGDEVLPPLLATLDTAYSEGPDEVRRLGADLEGGWINERVEAYIDLLHEYFKAYADYDQTLVYAKMRIPLEQDRHATSADFAATKMFYGNAFEVLGSHLDFVVAIFNIINARPYDQLAELSLTQY